MDSMDKIFHPSLAAALMKLDPEDGEKMMEYFQTHALLAREKSLLQASVREQKKLLVENGKLKKDIEQLRKELHDKQRRRVAKALLSLSKPADPPSPTPSNELEAERGRKGTKMADVSHLNLRVGRILSVRRHPLAANLAVQDVDLGENTPRVVVSKWRSDHLVGSLAVLLCNVKAGKVKGVASQARLLRCFHPDGPFELLAPPPGSAPGDRVTFPDFPGEPERELRPKRRLWERVQPGMHVDARGVANYQGCDLQVKGKGPCKAPSLTDCAIGCT
nr:aminoacyl tRNA synthase complex-interacting multifunctional protein 1-like [Nerophis lumbriciformis]